MCKLVTNIFFIGLIGIFSTLIFAQTSSNLNQSLAQVPNSTNSNSSSNLNQSLAQVPNSTNSNSSSNLTNSFYPAKALFVASKPQGYGIYEERNSNVYQPGENIILYIEPVGFMYKNVQDSQGNPLYSISFSGSFIIYDNNGKNLTDQVNVPISDIISHYKNKEVYIPFTISQATPFPPGKYQIKYSITDRNSGNTFDIIKNIVISNGI